MYALPSHAELPEVLEGPARVPVIKDSGSESHATYGF